MNQTIFAKIESELIPFSPNLLIIHETKVLDTPKFTYKEARKYIEGLTYRRINFWDSQGFISGYRRGKNTGWRKFSVVDLLKLNIITDLRNLGVSASFIRNTLKNLEKKVFKVDLLLNQYKKTIVFKQLNLHYLGSVLGLKILLLVFRDGINLILTEKDSIEVLPKMYDLSPTIILPFYVYVDRIASLLELEYSINESSTILVLLKNQIGMKEQVILDTIKNDKYREIIITKKNKDKIIVTAESVRSGKFSKKELLDLIDSRDYQDIKTSKVDGNIIKIYQKEKIKL